MHPPPCGNDLIPKSLGSLLSGAPAVQNVTSLVIFKMVDGAKDCPEGVGVQVCRKGKFISVYPLEPFGFWYHICLLSIRNRDHLVEYMKFIASMHMYVSPVLCQGL
jgi:hypothetical protein